MLFYQRLHNYVSRKTKCTTGAVLILPIQNIFINLFPASFKGQIKRGHKLPQVLTCGDLRQLVFTRSNEAQVAWALASYSIFMSKYPHVKSYNGFIKMSIRKWKSALCFMFLDILDDLDDLLCGNMYTWLLTCITLRVAVKRGKTCFSFRSNLSTVKLWTNRSRSGKL